VKINLIKSMGKLRLIHKLRLIISWYILKAYYKGYYVPVFTNTYQGKPDNDQYILCNLAKSKTLPKNGLLPKFEYPKTGRRFSEKYQ
jgi:hypothetical protein